LRAQLQTQLQNPPAPPPSIWDDEQGFGQHIADQATQQAVQQATFNARLDMSEMMVRMALTTVTTNLKEQVWDNDFFTNYVRKNRFNRYMGTDENAVIQIKEDLTKKAGDTIHLALVAELSGAGVTGDGLLEGNEEALSQYEFPIVVSTLRNAVAVTLNQEQFTGIDLRNAGKTMLQNWAMRKLRTDIITRSARSTSPAPATCLRHGHRWPAQHLGCPPTPIA
jgi:hypothetical protein